jgi:hypothetical protein
MLLLDSSVAALSEKIFQKQDRSRNNSIRILNRVNFQESCNHQLIWYWKGTIKAVTCVLFPIDNLITVYVKSATSLHLFIWNNLSFKIENWALYCIETLGPSFQLSPESSSAWKWMTAPRTSTAHARKHIVPPSSNLGQYSVRHARCKSEVTSFTLTKTLERVERWVSPINFMHVKQYLSNQYLSPSFNMFNSSKS